MPVWPGYDRTYLRQPGDAHRRSGPKKGLHSRWTGTSARGLIASWSGGTGRVVEWTPPDPDLARVDAGVTAGSVVGIEYDPLLAKVVTWGETRAEARTRAIAALRDFGVQGVVTNRAFLADVLRHHAFAAGELTTHFIADHMADWAPTTVNSDLALAVAIHDAERRRASSSLLPALRAGWRNNPVRDQVVRYLAGEAVIEVRYATDRDGYRTEGRAVRVVTRDGAALTLDVDGRRRTFHVVADGDARHVRCGLATASYLVEPRFPDPDTGEADGGCVAPMPGRVVQLLVATGDEVAKGQPLVVLEAMKMEQTMSAAEAGTVTAVRCAVGDVVDAGAVLVEVE